jgi:hypothetical protein
VLFVKVPARFPFPLSKADKQSLAQILAQGNKKAARWSMEGTDLACSSGERSYSVESKPFRLSAQSQPTKKFHGTAAPLAG